MRRVETRKRRTRTLGIFSMQAEASSQLTLCGREWEVFESPRALPTTVVVKVAGAKLVDKRNQSQKDFENSNEDLYCSE